MCLFITSVLPTSINLEQYGELFRANGRSFLPLENPSIRKQIGPKEAYYSTGGNCDCDTVLGSGAHDGENKLPKEAEKLRKMGWSEAKIMRWVRDKNKSREKHRQRKVTEGGRASDWVEMIAGFLDESRLPYMGVLLHMYRGNLDEAISLKSMQDVPRGSLTKEFLLDLKDDVLYRFQK